VIDRRTSTAGKGPGPSPEVASTPGPRRSLLLAHASGAVVLGGVQGIVPALPEIQRALQLTDTQIGLVNSIYFLPSVLLAIPAGLLMDRVGRREVLTAALALFGLTGLGLLVVPSFELLLLLRALQGVAFAAVLPLSVTLVGDLLSGLAQVREQGLRMVFLTGSDVALALLGGALVAVSWQAPFVLHTAALPLAVVAWAMLDGGPPRRQTWAVGSDLAGLATLLRTKLALAIQSLGLLRFFFKFALLTYSPVLLSSRGWSAPAIAVGIAATAAAASAAAVSARSVNARWPATTVLSVSLVATAVGFGVLATTRSDVLMAACLLLLGASEGTLGVLANAVLLEGVSAERRALFVSAAAAFKNLGKFAAPTVLSLLVLAMPVSGAFLMVGAVALGTLALVPPLRPLDTQLARDDDARPEIRPS
jgi:MFS family permease